MRISHTKKVCLLWEVTGVDQALVQQIVATVEEAHHKDIRNQMTNSINNTVAAVMTHR